MAVRLCACNCGQSLEGRDGHVRYVSPAHQQRAYRKRQRDALKAAGLPTSLSELVHQAVPTSSRNGDGHRTARSRSGLQVSYRKAVEAGVLAVEAALELDDRPLAR